MEKSRKIIDIVFKTITKLSDDEIEGIINREGKISILGLKQYQENIYAPKFWALDY